MAENEIVKVAPIKTTELVIPDDAPMMTRMAMMIEKGVKIDIDQMSKMQEMSERFEANEARKAFAADFTLAQANIEAAIKTAVNPQTHSNYAKLDSIIEVSKPVYTEYGFSVIFSEGETDKPEHIRICADVLHKDGHEKPYYYDVPMGGTGIQGKVNMTKIHGKATSISYGQRYLLCMIWNIATKDIDGNQPTQKTEMPRVKEVEQKALDKVFDGLCDSAPDGKRLSMDVMTKFIFDRHPEHKWPRTEEDAIKAVNWILNNKYINLVCVDDVRTKFEKDNDLPGDEDSQN